MKDLKQAVLETLKTKGYHEFQLKELNPIIQATIEATRQALSLGAVSGSFDYGFIEWIGKYHLKIIRVGGTTIWNSGSKYWRFESIDEMHQYYLKNYR